MHDESPVIHKLLRYGKVDSDATNTATTAAGGVCSWRSSKKSNIILWCRRYRPEVKNFSPYVCFGRMGYRSHVPGSRPLSFVWDLLDYDGLKHHDDPDVRETFELFTR